MSTASIATDTWRTDSGNRFANDLPRVLVIGGGPAGVYLVNKLIQAHPDWPITLFSDEPYSPYDRVQLSRLLAGKISRNDINLSLPNVDRNHQFRFISSAITHIDRDNKHVRDNNGQTYHYDKLIVATGAHAHRPAIEGIDLSGVFTFRSLRDTESLSARLLRSRHIVVLGGGLLGLETAGSLNRNGTQVTVVHQGPHLMNRQLDEASAQFLSEDLQQQQINVRLGSGVRKIAGSLRVDRVELANGDHIECDTVIICAGIRPNTQLAVEAALPIHYGIVVDDHLQTADPNIYAIGECCEHRGATYGLVNPGFEQAAIVAANLIGNIARYHGSAHMSRLKVIDSQVVSLGQAVEYESHPQQQEITFKNSQQRLFRKLIIRKGKIIGAAGYGEWPEVSRIQSLFQDGKAVSVWQRWCFRLLGRTSLVPQTTDINSWADNAIICQCKQVSKGRILECQKAQTGIESIQEHTGAGTVCGSCEPMIRELTSVSTRTRFTEWQPLIPAVVSLLAITIFMLWPAPVPADSVQSISWFEVIYRDGFWKQVSGFSMLGLGLIAMIMSIKKRTLTGLPGAFASWRWAHMVLGIVIIATLILHTGFSIGENLNRYLLLNFSLILLLGGIAAAAISISQTLAPIRSRSFRKFFNRLHIFACWPLPVLLISHIVSVYYF